MNVKMQTHDEKIGVIFDKTSSIEYLNGLLRNDISRLKEYAIEKKLILLPDNMLDSLAIIIQEDIVDTVKELEDYFKNI